MSETHRLHLHGACGDDVPCVVARGLGLSVEGEVVLVLRGTQTRVSMGDGDNAHAPLGNASHSDDTVRDARGSGGREWRRRGGAHGIERGEESGEEGEVEKEGRWRRRGRGAHGIERRERGHSESDLLELEHCVCWDAAQVLPLAAQHVPPLAGEALDAVVVVHSVRLDKGAHNPSSGGLEEAVAVAVAVGVKGRLQGRVGSGHGDLRLVVGVRLGLLGPHLLVLAALAHLCLAVLVAEPLDLLGRKDLPE